MSGMEQRAGQTLANQGTRRCHRLHQGAASCFVVLVLLQLVDNQLLESFACTAGYITV